MANEAMQNNADSHDIDWERARIWRRRLGQRTMERTPTKGLKHAGTGGWLQTVSRGLNDGPMEGTTSDKEGPLTRRLAPTARWTAQAGVTGWNTTRPEDDLHVFVPTAKEWVQTKTTH